MLLRLDVLQNSSTSARRLSSWIDGFIEYTRVKPSPEIFRRWTAISTLASIMSRKLWIVSMDDLWYANLFVFLIGPPAVGKTASMTVAREAVWRELKEYHIAPKSMTAASMSDSLQQATVKILMPNHVPPYIEFNSLIISSPELGVLMSQYDREIMQRLTDLFDNGTWEETRRSAKININIERAQLNMLAAATPSFLNEMLPVGAWDQGFISRVILVFSGDHVRKSFFEKPPEQEALRRALIDDAKTISSLYGKMDWTPEAAAAMQAWEDSGGQPTPDHVKLIHYVGRRSSNMLKLCMVASVSRSNEKVIRLEDFETAKAWLLDAEIYMPDIFKAMKSSTTDGSTIDEAWYFCWQIWTKERKPIPESRLIHFIQQRSPSYAVMQIIELMRRSNMITSIGADQRGNLYEPVPKGQHQA